MDLRRSSRSSTVAARATHEQKQAMIRHAASLAAERRDARLAAAAEKAKVTGQVDELADLLASMGVGGRRRYRRTLKKAGATRRRRHTRRV